MPNEKERDNTMRGEINARVAEARDWIKKQWNWIPDDVLDALQDTPERLRTALREHLGERDWQADYDRLIRQFPEIERQGYGGYEDKQDDADLREARSDIAVTEAAGEETSHTAKERRGPKGPIDDRELDQRQRGPGAE